MNPKHHSDMKINHLSSFAGYHSKPTVFTCFPSNPQLVWGQFNLSDSLHWKTARNKGQSSESPGLTSDQTHPESFHLKSTMQSPFLKETFPAGFAAVPSLQRVSNVKQPQQMVLNQGASRYREKRKLDPPQNAP